MDELLTKDYPVFDCDAHVVEPASLMGYVPEADRELMRNSGCWTNDEISPLGLLNGSRPVMFSSSSAALRGPGCDVPTQRALYMRPDLSAEQRQYLDHAGARDPIARLEDMDIMGIDQVLVIPSTTNSNLPFIENAHAARAFARALNDWLADYCAVAPERLYPCAAIPTQFVPFAVEELRRAAEMGFKVVSIRPGDFNGLYPNQGAFDALWKTAEELGVVIGMHTFVAGEANLPANKNRRQYSPGELIWLQGARSGLHPTTSQTASFIYEAMTWISYITLSGFLDRYPNLKMTIFESNAMWLPAVLEQCDRLFKLYASERRTKGGRLPSEAFLSQCRISFESEEREVFAMHEYFEKVAIWASDMYHRDAATAWEAVETMREEHTPPERQARMMALNACEFYNIEPKLFVTEQPDWKAPDWFPDEEELARAMQYDALVTENIPPGSPARMMADFFAAGNGTWPGVDELEVH